MKLSHTRNDGRITERTKDDFLRWVKKQKALKKRQVEQNMYAKALAVWADDGGAHTLFAKEWPEPDRKKN